MEIRNIGSRLEGLSSPSRSPSPHSGSPASSKAHGAAAQDSFENSGRLGEVRTLIDALIQVPEIRTDQVQKARELLAQGQLDTPEAATQAAHGFVESAVGQEG